MCTVCNIYSLLYTLQAVQFRRITHSVLHALQNIVQRKLQCEMQHAVHTESV